MDSLGKGMWLGRECGSYAVRPEWGWGSRVALLG